MSGVSWSFASKVAAQIGATPDYVYQILNAWEPWENANASFNPLATTQHADGSWALGGNPNQNGGNPVQEYPTEDIGAAATAQTLLNGYYPNLLNGLRTGNVNASAAPEIRLWGTTGFANQLDGGGGVSYTPPPEQAAPAYTPPPAPVQDPSGYDPSTGLPYGVIRYAQSPTGYSYNGQAVYSDGSVYGSTGNYMGGGRAGFPSIGGNVMADPWPSSSGGSSSSSTDIGWINVADSGEVPTWYNTKSGKTITGGPMPTTALGSQPAATGSGTSTDINHPPADYPGHSWTWDGNSWMPYPIPSSGGSSGGGISYTQEVDSDGSVTGVPGAHYQLSSSGAVSNVRAPASTAVSGATPGDKNGDGIDDSSGLAVGVVKVSTNLSPSGYIYGTTPVWPNGAPLTQADLASLATTGGSGSSGGGYGSSKVDVDGSITGNPGTVYQLGGDGMVRIIGSPKAASSSSSGGSSTAAVRLPSISSGGGSSSSGGSIDVSQQAHDAATAAAADAQRTWQGQQNDIDRAIAAGQFAQAQQLQRVQQQGQLARDYASELGATDPNAFGAFLFANGGNINNGLRAGQDALSDASNLPAARTMEALNGLGGTTGGNGQVSALPGGGGLSTGTGGTPATGATGGASSPAAPGSLPLTPDQIARAAYVPTANAPTYDAFLSNQRVHAGLESPLGQYQTAQAMRANELAGQGWRDIGGIAVQVPDVASSSLTPQSVGDRMAGMPGGLTGAALEVYNRNYPAGGTPLPSGDTTANPGWNTIPNQTVVPGLAGGAGIPYGNDTTGGLIGKTAGGNYGTPQPGAAPGASLGVINGGSNPNFGAGLPGYVQDHLATDPNMGVIPYGNDDVRANPNLPPRMASGGQYLPDDGYDNPSLSYAPASVAPNGSMITQPQPQSAPPPPPPTPVTTATGQSYRKIPAQPQRFGTPRFAMGGMAQHMFLAGDSRNGRPTGHEEAVIAPQGAQVLNHQQTLAMLGGQGGLQRVLAQPSGQGGMMPRFADGTENPYQRGTQAFDNFNLGRPIDYAPAPPPVYQPQAPVYHPPAPAPPPVQQAPPPVQAQSPVAPAPAPPPAYTAPAQPAPPPAGLGSATPQAPAAPGGTYGGQSGASPTYTQPMTPGALGITGDDRNYLNSVLTARQNADYPHLNQYAVDFAGVDPTMRDAFYAGQQTKYGIPIASNQAETEKYALKGFTRGLVRQSPFDSVGY